MDHASSSAKTSANLLGIANRFSKVCRLRSHGGIAADENPNCIPSFGESRNAAEETGNRDDWQKIHPQSFVLRDISGSMDILRKLFDVISSLKLTYIQFQKAHTPYDPERVQATDNDIVSKLKYISEIKHSYIEKQNLKHISDSSSFTSSSSSCCASSSSLHSSSHTSIEIQEQRCFLEKLQAQIQSKDSKIIILKRKLEELDQKNAKLEEKANQKEEEIVYFSRNLSFNQFYAAYKATLNSIHDFAKPLIGLMKASGWDLDAAASHVEDSVIYARRSDKKYAFDAYICQKMFGGEGWPRPCNFSGVTILQDPFDALVEDPNSEFAKFCCSKYLLVVHLLMEQSFFGNLDHREFVMSGGHPRTPLYQAFAKMAKWVWVLMKMAGSMNPMAEIFWVKNGCKFSEACMQSVVNFVEGEGMKVGLMVMPGFRIGDRVIRSRVYVSTVKTR